MKKTIPLICVIFCCLHILSAEEPVKTRGANLWVDLFPLLEFNTRKPEPADYEMTNKDLEWALNRPALVSGGVAFNVGPFRALTIMELQQDVGALLAGSSLTNLIVKSNYSGLSSGSNYPLVGFIEGNGDNWQVSLGRRVIHMGEGSLSLSLSNSNPWYDHFLAGMKSPLRAGSIEYLFTAINVPRRIDPAKYLFSHRIGWKSEKASFFITEFNLVTDVALDFQDFGPFNVYHHLFADGSNVMLQINGHWKPINSVRLFAEFLIDDFRLSTESENSNPNGMGFSSGIQWQIKESTVPKRTSFSRKDYGIIIGSDQFTNGTVLSLEGYFASTYLYRRNSSLPYQTISNRYFIQTNEGNWQTVDSWFAYPLGPDRAIIRLNLAQKEEYYDIFIGFDLSFIGSQSEELHYTTTNNQKWVGPSDSVSIKGDLNLKATYDLNENSTLFFNSFINLFSPKSTPISLSIGYARRFGFE